MYPNAAAAMTPTATLPATGSVIDSVFPRLARLPIFLPRSVLWEEVSQQIIINFEAIPLGPEIVGRR
jgi:hypothetical protein